MAKICDFGLMRVLENDERLYVMSAQKKVPFAWLVFQRVACVDWIIFSMHAVFIQRNCDQSYVHLTGSLCNSNTVKSIWTALIIHKDHSSENTWIEGVHRNPYGTDDFLMRQTFGLSVLPCGSCFHMERNHGLVFAVPRFVIVSPIVYRGQNTFAVIS